MHYNKKLRELYGLEEKVVKESAQDTKLKQELVDLKEKLAKITTLEAKLDQLYGNQRNMAALLCEQELDTTNHMDKNTMLAAVDSGALDHYIYLERILRCLTPVYL